MRRTLLGERWRLSSRVRLRSGSAVCTPETPQYLGRAVAALASDPEVMAKSGQLLTVGELAREYGFTDIDGTQPEPFTISRRKPGSPAEQDATDPKPLREPQSADRLFQRSIRNSRSTAQIRCGMTVLCAASAATSTPRRRKATSTSPA